MEEIYVVEVFSEAEMEDGTFGNQTKILLFQNYKIMVDNVVKLLGYIGNSEKIIKKGEEINQSLIKQLGKNKIAYFERPNSHELFSVQIALLEIMRE